MQRLCVDAANMTIHTIGGTQDGLRLLTCFCALLWLWATTKLCYKNCPASALACWGQHAAQEAVPKDNRRRLHVQQCRSALAAPSCRVLGRYYAD